jgi:hypothetical protein
MWLRVVAWTTAAVVAALLAASPQIGEAAGTCQVWGTQPPTAANGENALSGVSATSSCNAWAVGSYTDTSLVTRTLIEHWNGSNWVLQLGPNPDSAYNTLNGVAATSTTNAWAVGLSGSSPSQALIERWTGSSWHLANSQHPGTDSELFGAAALSSTNAWAVGDYSDASSDRTLIEHWNGSAWKVVPSPNRGTGDNRLFGVAAASSKSAWAVGYAYVNNHYQALIEHWNGIAWKLATSPTSTSSDNSLSAVSASSATNIWAVGYANTAGHEHPLIVHSTGSTWTVKPSADPSAGGPSYAFLQGVSATSSSNAWAVGDITSSGGDHQTLIERWNGTKWSVQPSPNPGSLTGGPDLEAIDATSSTNAWAVGSYHVGSYDVPLALHCC